MKTKLHAAITAGLASALCWVSSARAADDSLVTAVFSNVKNGYVRAKLPDGSFKRETYVIAKGGFTPGRGVDHSIDDVRFAGIVRLLAPFLARRNYYPAQDGKTADLMLVVYWGETIPFSDGTYQNTFDRGMEGFKAFQRAGNGIGGDPFRPAGVFNNPEGKQGGSEMEFGIASLRMAELMRDQADQRNARLLGYLREINDRRDIAMYAGGGTYYDDLISDIEEERYYVVIGAYDFQAALRKNDEKLLWSTRVSIRAQGNRFDEQLMAMIARASRYFGQDSGRLIRQYERVPHVDYGELRSLGVVSDARRAKP